MAILFVFLSAQFGIVSIHAERRNRTLARMLAAPLRWWSILAGKLIVSMVLALVSMGVIIVGTGLLLGATWGDPAALVALVLSAALAATGISLADGGLHQERGAGRLRHRHRLAHAGRHRRFLLSRPTRVRSCSRSSSLLTPHAWFLDAINDISTGGDLGSSVGSVAVLATIGLVTGGLGLLRARRMVFAMRAAVEIARVNLLRVLRDRTNLFFVFLLPLIIIIALGAAFGGTGVSRLGVVATDAGPLGDELVAILEDGPVEVDVRDARLARRSYERAWRTATSSSACSSRRATTSRCAPASRWS